MNTLSIYILYTEENEKILQENGFHCEFKTDFKPYLLVVYIDDMSYDIWRENVYDVGLFISMKEFLEYLEAHRGELGMSKLNLI